jgi:D-alanyl-D-alanine dipeptidase
MAWLTVALLIVVAGLLGNAPSEQPSQSPLRGSRQLLVVVTASWTAVGGTLQRFERETATGPWTAVGSRVAVVVGRNGLAWGRGVADGRATGGPVKKEGDGKAPAGVFRLGTSFGHSRQPLPGVALPYRSLDGTVECVDDVRSAHYNRLVTRQEVDRVDWSSSERMWAEPLYKWGIVVGHNTPDVAAGDGSCIFLHIWKDAGTGTAGCTAMDERSLAEIIAWLQPASSPLFIQLPREEYDRLKSAWDLPLISSFADRAGGHAFGRTPPRHRARAGDRIRTAF